MLIGPEQVNYSQTVQKVEIEWRKAEIKLIDRKVAKTQKTKWRTAHEKVATF